MNESQVKNQTIAPGLDEAPMAVYPLNSSAKLDQEPNPFEQSFSGVTTIEESLDKKEENKLKLPPVAAITSPSPLNVKKSVIGGGVLPKEVTNQFTWETLRTGPLSPSMLQGPLNSEEYYKTSTNTATLNNVNIKNSFSNTSNYSIKVEQQPSNLYENNIRSRQSSTASLKENESKQKMKRNSSSQIDSEDESYDGRTTKRKQNSKATIKPDDDDEKRKNFLERNRIAALKCRQRKKQWLNNLQAKVEYLTTDNERLQLQSESLKEEIVNLKTLLLAHKDCPIAQSNGFNTNSIQKGIPTLLPATDIMRQPMNFTQPTFSRNTTSSRSNSISNHRNSISSTSIPQFQNNNLNLPIQPQQSSNQPSMVTSGSSSVIRF